jgi:hypothetical protein
LEDFRSVAPYLTNPIALVGYVLFLVLGVQRLLLKSKVLSKVSPESSHSLLQTLLRYGFILAIVVILLGFANTFWKEYKHSPMENRAVPMRVPLATPPFRVQYFLLGGRMVDLFLRGKVDQSWEKQLSGQPFIIPTATFSRLTSLTDRFSEPFNADQLITPDYDRKMASNAPYSQEDELSAEQLATKFRGTAMFVGTDASLAAITAGRPGSQQDIESLGDPSYGWHVKASPYGNESTGVDALDFWRFGTPSDLQTLSQDRFAGRSVGFLQYVTKNHFPNDFCIVSMGSAGCDSEHNQYFALHTRAVFLRVIAIDNPTSQPMSIGSFTVRENVKDVLRSREQDQSELNQNNLRVYKWFSPAVLAPHETIAIPVEIVFRYDKDKNWDLYHLEKDSDAAHLSSLRNEFKRQSILTLRYYTQQSDARQSEHEVPVSSETLIHLIDQPAFAFGLQREYVYGPTIKLESLEVDQAEYRIRQFDPHILVIRDGGGKGSCPYIYTYSIRDHEWVSEGHILYGANGRSKETSDSVLLPDFDGQVVMREEERETTFVKTTYISVSGPSGKAEKYYATTWKSLRRKDGYVELRQGESVRLKFALPENLRGTPRLVVRGFYIPH